MPASIGPQFFKARITVQYDLRHFLPVRIFGLGVEKAHIGHEMPLVIGGDLVSCRRDVIHIGIKFDRNPHRHSPSSWESDGLRCAPANKTL